MVILTPLLLLKQEEVDFVQILMMKGNESLSQVPFYCFSLLLFYFISFQTKWLNVLKNIVKFQVGIFFW